MFGPRKYAIISNNAIICIYILLHEGIIRKRNVNETFIFYVKVELISPKVDMPNINFTLVINSLTDFIWQNYFLSVMLEATPCATYIDCILPSISHSTTALGMRHIQYTFFTHIFECWVFKKRKHQSK